MNLKNITLIVASVCTGLIIGTMLHPAPRNGVSDCEIKISRVNDQVAKIMPENATTTQMSIDTTAFDADGKPNGVMHTDVTFNGKITGKIETVCRCVSTLNDTQMVMNVRTGTVNISNDETSPDYHQQYADACKQFCIEYGQHHFGF